MKHAQFVYVHFFHNTTTMLHSKDHFSDNGHSLAIVLAVMGCYMGVCEAVGTLLVATQWARWLMPGIPRAVHWKWPWDRDLSTIRCIQPNYCKLYRFTWFGNFSPCAISDGVLYGCLCGYGHFTGGHTLRKMVNACCLQVFTLEMALR